jgi:hypothetical protein
MGAGGPVRWVLIEPAEQDLLNQLNRLNLLNLNQFVDLLPGKNCVMKINESRNCLLVT